MRPEPRPRPLPLSSLEGRTMRPPVDYNSAASEPRKADVLNAPRLLPWNPTPDPFVPLHDS